ncbi:MAG: hypothetical protein AB7P69_22000 [Candidatus Binatia bacterium]
MTPRGLFDRLIDFERRVRQLYQRWGNQKGSPAEICFFWNCMAEDERHHIAILERSTGLLDLMELPPQITEEALTAIQEKIKAAETAAQQETLSNDEALHHALILEGSELNRMDEAWFRAFRPTMTTLLQAMMPEEEVHLRRLVEAVHTFSTDDALQEQATELWSTYQKQQLGTA